MMNRRATIIKKDRWLLPYEVQREADNVKRYVSCHITMRRAERAAKRFTRVHEPDRLMGTWEADDTPPTRTIPRRYE